MSDNDIADKLGEKIDKLLGSLDFCFFNKKTFNVAYSINLPGTIPPMQ